MFTANFLFASLLWGSIGVGCFIYGKRQQSFSAMGGGLLMIAVSYFSSSALLMSLICIVAVVAVYQLVRRGYRGRDCAGPAARAAERPWMGWPACPHNW